MIERKYYVIVYDELFEGNDVEGILGVFNSVAEAQKEARFLALNPRITSHTIYQLKKIEGENESD